MYGIYKFGNNLPSAQKGQVEFRSHFSGKKCASYGLGNMVINYSTYIILIIIQWIDK